MTRCVVGTKAMMLKRRLSIASIIGAVVAHVCLFSSYHAYLVFVAFLTTERAVLVWQENGVWCVCAGNTSWSRRVYISIHIVFSNTKKWQKQCAFNVRKNCLQHVA